MPEITMERPLVSVVVTTKNEEKNIEQCLRSIRLQTYENIETIVIDNFSTDKTKEIASRYTDKVYEKGPERSAQRNFGMINMSSGKYVMFVDADMMLSPSLIESCVGLMEQERLAALHIPEIVLGTGYLSRVRRFERSFYNGTVIDGLRFFSKQAFIEAGGFDEGMSGPEDWDMDKKIKSIGRVGLAEEAEDTEHWEMNEVIIRGGVHPASCGVAVFHNETEFRLKGYLAKKEYYSQSFDAYIKKWGREDPDIRKQLGLYYRFLGVFIENGKWKRMIFHPFLVVGMYFLRFMVGIKFLMVKEKRVIRTCSKEG